MLVSALSIILKRLHTVPTLILFVFSLQLAQPLASTNDYDQTYYDLNKLKGLKGRSLKSALHHLLDQTHRSQSYGALYYAYLEGDLDEEFEGDHSIMDMYSERPGDSERYNYFSRGDTCGNYRGEGSCFNREHLFPQSAFNKRSPMRTDYFHVQPTDGYVNNVRGSHPFGEVVDVEWTSENGSKLGRNRASGYSGDFFEPIDEFKGDIARALLYFAIRYEDRIRSFRHRMLDGSDDRVYDKPFLDILLRWHKLDPVSAFEKRRNDNGFKFQGNRNPLIDHPEWVSQIWDHI